MARICMLAFTDFFSDARVRREAETLVRRGDEVDLICLREKKRKKVRYLNNGTANGVQLELPAVRLYQLSISRYRGASTVTYLLKYSR